MCVLKRDERDELCSNLNANVFFSQSGKVVQSCRIWLLLVQKEKGSSGWGWGTQDEHMFDLTRDDASIAADPYRRPLGSESGTQLTWLKSSVRVLLIESYNCTDGNEVIFMSGQQSKFRVRSVDVATSPSGQWSEQNVKLWKTCANGGLLQDVALCLGFVWNEGSRLGRRS